MGEAVAEHVDAFKPAVDGDAVRFTLDPTAVILMTAGIRTSVEVQDEPAQPAKLD